MLIFKKWLDIHIQFWSQTIQNVLKRGEIINLASQTLRRKHELLLHEGNEMPSTKNTSFVELMNYILIAKTKIFFT